ncbi:MAG: twin-arginine translocase TatA/TatE family subunit [Candidatus Acidiferrum sp.]
MLSVPHMIVVFLVVLVVFGPQKLPELARSFGKLMAEFRKASNDFKGAFEEEMRDLERQARVAELRKQTAEANAAADAALKNTTPPVTLATSSETPALTSEETPVTSSAPETVPRLDAENMETEAKTAVEPPAENPPTHDQQQPA